MPVSDLERLVLLGVSLNDATNYSIDGTSFKYTPPQKKPAWATNPAADGDALVEESNYTNSTFEFTILVEPTGTKAKALEELGKLLDVLQECERIESGGALEWTPAETETTYTAYVSLAEINDLPITVAGEDAGWMLNSPVLKVKLTAGFLYGEESQVLAPAESALPLQEAYVSVGGDVPAEARLIVTDKATQNRRFAELGREVVASKEGNPSLLLTAASLTVSGFAGESTTRTGAYSEEKVKRLKTIAGALTFCGTGAIKHVGSYRVYGRVYAASEDCRIQIAYRTGTAPLTTLEWIEPPFEDQWADLFLGEVTFEEVPQGEQRSEILFNGKTVGTVDEALDLNYITLIPTTASRQVVRGPLSPLIVPTSFKARDSFDQTAGALNGKALPDGSGNWATSGSAKGDFEVVAGATHAVVRTAKEDASARLAKCPAAEASLVAAQVSFEWSALVGNSELVSGFDFGGSVVAIATLIPGVASYFLVGSAALSYVFTPGTKYTMTALVSGSTLAALWITTDGLFPSGEPDLISGNIGIAKASVSITDTNSSTTSVTRTYDDFSVWIPEVLPVCHSSRKMEINHKRAELADAEGKYWGPVPFARGGRFYLTPEGHGGVSNRLAFRARRNDIENEADANVTDKHEIEVLARERFLAPR